MPVTLQRYIANQLEDKGNGDGQNHDLQAVSTRRRQLVSSHCATLTVTQPARTPLQHGEGGRTAFKGMELVPLRQGDGEGEGRFGSKLASEQGRSDDAETDSTANGCNDGAAAAGGPR